MAERFDRGDSWSRPGLPPPPEARPHPGPWDPEPPGYRPRPKNNGLAITSLICGCLYMYGIGSLLAVLFGHIALVQIRRAEGRQTGEGLARAGLVLGYIGVAVFGLIYLVVLSG